jgi:hypothetical protein
VLTYLVFRLAGKRTGNIKAGGATALATGAGQESAERRAVCPGFDVSWEAGVSRCLGGCYGRGLGLSVVLKTSSAFIPLRPPAPRRGEAARMGKRSPAQPQLQGPVDYLKGCTLRDYLATALSHAQTLFRSSALFSSVVSRGQSLLCYSSAFVIAHSAVSGAGLQA